MHNKRTVRPPLYTALAPGTERMAAEIKPPAACLRMNATWSATSPLSSSSPARLE